MEPAPELTTIKMGFLDFCNSGREAWNKRTTPAALTSTCSIRSEVFISATFWKAASLYMPALAMTVSMWLIFCDERLLMACFASVSEVDSTLTRITLLPEAAGSWERALESVALGLRTVPMMVVLGRVRYFLTKPSPIPRG